MKIKQPAVVAILAGVLSSTCYAAEWSYSGEHGTEHWGETFTTCGEGANQTPIDITSPTQAELAPLHIEYQGQISELTNNGHTVQANVTAGSSLSIDGEQFELKQFHFHTPSENYLKGKQFPLEAHFVHANADGQLAVIGVMFDTGPRANDPLSALLTSIPKKKERHSPSQPNSTPQIYYPESVSITASTVA